MKKRLISLTLALALALALSVPALAAVAHNPNSSPPPASSTTQTPAASSTKAPAATLKGQYGTVTLSEVSKTEKVTLKFASESKTVTVYYIPSTCVLNNSGAADIVVYSKTGDYYSPSGYVQGSSVTLSASFDLIEVAFGGGDNYYLMKGSGSGSSTTKTPATPQQPNSTPSKSADKTTVTVAGTDRTPGQLQNYNSGYLYTVQSGDTLYGLSERFYGSGSYWKELQKVNQANLNKTKDGIIFVGFNLILPAELGGVRVNIG